MFFQWRLLKHPEYWGHSPAIVRKKPEVFEQKTTKPWLPLRFPWFHDGIVAASFAFIACRVPYETKARLRRLAELEGTNESAVMRRVLNTALALTAAPGPDDELAPAQDRPGRNQPVVVRLTADDRRRLQERADSRGIAAATYMAVLVHTQLSGVAPPLPKAEYLMLRQTILELAGIGRNLNQITRAMDRGGEVTPPGRAEFTAMLKVAEALRDHFKELIRANQAAWSRNGTTRR